METDDFVHDRPLDPPPDGRPAAAMATMLIWIPPALIALFKALIESYDNLATLRTEDPANHLLRLSFAPESAPDVHALIDAVSAQFSLRRIS